MLPRLGNDVRHPSSRTAPRIAMAGGGHQGGHTSGPLFLVENLVDSRDHVGVAWELSVRFDVYRALSRAPDLPDPDLWEHVEVRGVVLKQVPSVSLKGPVDEADGVDAMRVRTRIGKHLHIQGLNIFHFGARYAGAI